MSKKLKICTGNSCKKAGSHKRIKEWAKELKRKTNKTGCLGVCKSAYGVKFKGKIHVCKSKSGLEDILDS